MPRFQAKPVIVTAVQFVGSTTDLPLEFAAQLTQRYAGERAYLPSTAIGAYAEEEPKYATGDIVEVGDWIILGTTGFSRMSAPDFERAYLCLDEPVSQDEDARWQATYIGANDGSTPRSQTWLGYTFTLDTPVGINNPEHAAIVDRNAHFVVIDTAPEQGEKAMPKTLSLPLKTKVPA